MEPVSTSFIFRISDSLWRLGLEQGNNGGNDSLKNVYEKDPTVDERKIVGILAYHVILTPGRSIRIRYGSQYSKIVRV